MIVADLVKNIGEPTSFLDRPVEDDMLMNVMEAARLAPSASNTQVWRFFVVKERGLLKDISGLAKRESFRSAPVIVAAFAEPFILGRKAREQPFFIIDVPIALSHIVLMATELGLSACVEFEFDEKMTVDLLMPPKKYRAIALIALGYAKEFIQRGDGKGNVSIDEMIMES